MTTFSVIVPVYNGEKYIKETLDSIIKTTTDFDTEIIVVNDGSTDRTREVLGKFERVIVLIDQDNLGEASAVNCGISASKGEYGLIVSADDPLLSSSLFSEAIKIFKNEPDCLAVYPNWQMINDHGLVLKYVICSEFSTEKMIGQFKCLPGPGTIFRLPFAKQINGRNTTYKFTSDYDFWLRLSQFGYFQHIPQNLAQWRHHSDSTSINSRGIKMAHERISVITNFLNDFPQDKHLAKQALASAYYNAALLAFFNKAIPGRKWMLDAIKIKRGWVKGSRIIIVTYLLLLPWSRYLYKILEISKTNTMIRHK
jgi:glycosyltransferase involved in cell wall biosynthesis